MRTRYEVSVLKRAPDITPCTALLGLRPAQRSGFPELDVWLAPWHRETLMPQLATVTKHQASHLTS